VCRHHPEFLQTETDQHRSSPSPPPEDGDDDLDLPEAFEYEEEEDGVHQSAHVDEVTADFGFLDRPPDPDPTAGARANAGGKWTDFQPAENGTESQPKAPVKGADNEYLAC